MTNTAFLAYLLIVCYFIIERLLRKGNQALSLKPGDFDRGSSKVIWISGLFSLLLIIFAPILSDRGLGYLHSEYVGWVGINLMFIGLSFRYWAAKELGEFYTRTLQIVEGQTICDRPPYNIIRHPGYLGIFLMEVGASLALHNWIVLLVVMVLGITSRSYRIHTEETMLQANFSEQYHIYSQKTWRLIPFLY
jgi:protein-S-isoprenylcysteine O-methyltransferase Ste14